MCLFRYMGLQGVLFSEKSKVGKQCEWFDNFTLKNVILSVYSGKNAHFFLPRKKSTLRGNGTEVGKGAFILHFVSFCII